MIQTNPVRDAVRTEIIAALADGKALMSHELYHVCPSANDAKDVARLAHELVKKGVLRHGAQQAHPVLGRLTNSYVLATPEDTSNKRVTTDLPIPVVTYEFPQVSAVAQTTTAPKHEHITMSEDPTPYLTAINEAIDKDLVEALQGLAEDDPMTLASDYTGDEPRQRCQCRKISLPPLPKGYIYGGIKVCIESEHDYGHLNIATHDEGGGVFASIKASGRLSFDSGELVMIGQVADELIRLHESIGKQNNVDSPGE